jgi:hypothetical protein
VRDATLLETVGFHKRKRSAKSHDAGEKIDSGILCCEQRTIVSLEIAAFGCIQLLPLQIRENES